ncbi:MAG: putative potassium efflux system [Myxococcales bacterium]|nr:putative potassium efflux system [Myxococcales bacterium]
MPFVARLKDILTFPLLHLSSGPLTLAAILVCFVVLVCARLAAGLASRQVTAVLERREVADGARFAIAKIVRYTVTLLGVLVALTSLGIRLDALLAASTVLLVGIGFGLQNIAQNFISGLILLFERPVGRGDFVQLGSAAGTVVDIGMRATRVVTRDEVTIIVPNSELITAQVINHSVPTPNLRISVKVGVAYGSDTARVREELMRIAAADGALLPTPLPEVRFEDFGDSTLDFALLVWISDPREDRRTASRLRFAIDTAFRAAKIEIPYPQRDLHLRSGFDAVVQPLRALAGKEQP